MVPSFLLRIPLTSTCPPASAGFTILGLDPVQTLVISWSPHPHVLAVIQSRQEALQPVNYSEHRVCLRTAPLDRTILKQPGVTYDGFT